MPNDLDAVEYAASTGEGPELSLSRGGHRPRILRPLVAAAGVAVAVFGLFALVVSVVPPASRESLAPSIPDDGLLSDVRGEDKLYRLEARQAALRGEMALLREQVSGGVEGALFAETDLLPSLAELEAEHTMLGARVVRLEAGQRALHDEIMRLESVLSILFDRFIEPGELKERE